MLTISSCAAEPNVLANYVIALLKNNLENREKLQSLCEVELEDFLRDGTFKLLIVMTK